jgi:uncharacterized membrane protein
MIHLQDVQVIDDTHSHWATRAPVGKDATIEWDAEITEDRRNEMIAWRSLPGALVPNRGAVTFAPAPDNRGCEVRVDMAYEIPGGPVGELAAKLLGEDPKRQVYDDLRALKQVLETGEILYSNSSVHGRPHPATTVGQAEARPAQGGAQ